MLSIVFLFEICAGPNIVQADVLDAASLERSSQCNMWDIRIASDTTIKVYGTVTLHLGIADTRLRISFGVVREFTVPVLLQTTYKERFIK